LVAISLRRNKKCCGRWGSSRPFYETKPFLEDPSPETPEESTSVATDGGALPPVHQVAWRVPELLEALVRDPALSAFVAKEFGKGVRLVCVPDEGWPSVPSQALAPA
jgi:hypothetical protein